MTPHEPNRADLFSAYVQGELDPAAREVLEPPQKTEHEWNAVRSAVQRGIVRETIGTQTARQARWVRRGVAFAWSAAAATAAAAAVLLAILLNAGRKPEPSRYEELAESPEEFVVMPLATENDVVIERIAGSGNGLLFGDAPLALARENDVQIEETEPHPAWPGGSPKMIVAPGDAPMIYAAKAR